MEEDEPVLHCPCLFKRSKCVEVSRYGDTIPEGKVEVLTMRRDLEEPQLPARNGRPPFPFIAANSRSGNRANPMEANSVWARLSEGGSAGQCCWRKDQLGRSRQMMPRALLIMLTDPNADKVTRTARHEDDEQD